MPMFTVQLTGLAYVIAEYEVRASTREKARDKVKQMVPDSDFRDELVWEVEQVNEVTGVS